MSAGNQRLRELITLALLAALMFATQVALAALPNIHLLGVFTVAFTVVYRKKALYPIYIYVFLNGLYSGFNTWWIPYLYIWTILWGATMLLPKNMSDIAKSVVYTTVCALHGLFFGVLYAPVYAIMMKLDMAGIIAWVSAGISFDILHCIGNLAAGLLIVPSAKLLKKLSAQWARVSTMVLRVTRGERDMV